MTPFEVARRAAGFTQRSLAARLKISHVAVGKWERGESSPHPRLSKRLGRLLGRTPEDVVRMFEREPAAA